MKSEIKYALKVPGRGMTNPLTKEQLDQALATGEYAGWIYLVISKLDDDGDIISMEHLKLIKTKVTIDPQDMAARLEELKNDPSSKVEVSSDALEFFKNYVPSSSPKVTATLTTPKQTRKRGANTRRTDTSVIPSIEANEAA